MAAAEYPNVSSFLSANESYKASFKEEDAKKPAPPARKAAIVTCMDARIHIEPALGLAIGDAHVIRNAGGRVSKDALRSLAISERLLGTKEIYVIHHTKCGMVSCTNDKMCEVLKKDLGEGAESEGKQYDFLFFTDLEQSVRDDLQILKDSPLIPDDVETHGFIYDVESGGLISVK